MPTGTRAIDIGGGIMAVLLSRILGFTAVVGDVNRRAETDVTSEGLRFLEVDLLQDGLVPREQFDLVVLQEVIEHLPVPPYVVFERISRFLAPDGILFLTTPNGSRLRNILYLLAGRQVLDNFRYSEPAESMGHMHEYTLPHMLWQLDRAGMRPIFAER